MNCKNCGENISAFSNYCPNCGSKIDSEWSKIMSIFLKVQEFFKKRKWALGVLGGVIVGLIALGVILNISHTIELTDYIIIESEGYDGAGTICVNIDYDELCSKLLGEEPNPSTKSGYEKFDRYNENRNAIISSLKLSVDRTRELSNGDFFIVTIKITDDEIFKDFGYELKYETYKKTLQVGEDTKKLKSLTPIDVFEKVELKFNGTNGDGSFEISAEPSYIILKNADNDIVFKMEYYESIFQKCIYILNEAKIYILI